MELWYNSIVPPLVKIHTRRENNVQANSASQFHIVRIVEHAIHFTPFGCLGFFFFFFFVLTSFVPLYFPYVKLDQLLLRQPWELSFQCVLSAQLSVTIPALFGVISTFRHRVALHISYPKVCDFLISFQFVYGMYIVLIMRMISSDVENHVTLV